MAYNKLKTALAGVLTLGASSLALAADEKPLMSGASASMLANNCAGCHGTHGTSSGPATPSISGISPVYFEEQMQAFKSGEAKSTIMGRIAAGFSEEEIKAMGVYFSQQPFVPAVQPADDALAKEGAKLHDKYCEKCHSEGGTSVEDDAGLLAGQLTPYLRFTIADFKSGDREMPKKMKKQFTILLKKKGNAGLEALLNFYAQGK
jgi:cytochrome subunit of sulfide dehydrogenase